MHILQQDLMNKYIFAHKLTAIDCNLAEIWLKNDTFVEESVVQSKEGEIAL